MKIGELQWDDENIEHIGSHGIGPSEVEDVCFGLHISYPARYRRHLVFGKTCHGKYILVVVERLYGITFRPKTSRLMSGREEKNFRRRMK